MPPDDAPLLDEHAKVSAAVRAAETGTTGEIVTIVADRSDAYEDIALVYAGLAALFAPILFAAWPALPLRLVETFASGWGDTQVRDLMLLVFGAMALVSGLVFGLLQIDALRVRATPRAVRRRRVQRRAIDLFKVGAEGRTVGRTGILVYVSMSEHMAEIVADEGIHAVVDATRWGNAMIALVAHIREGHVADGLVAAVREIGAILAEHLPPGSVNPNELPDRLIEL